MAFNFPGFGGFQQPQRRPPQPRQRQPLNPKQKKQLRTVGIVVAVLIGIFVIVPPLVSVYTGWLWFDSLAKGGVFGTILGTRLGLFLIFGALSAVILYLCMELARLVLTPCWILTDAWVRVSTSPFSPLSRQCWASSLVFLHR